MINMLNNQNTSELYIGSDSFMSMLMAAELSEKNNNMLNKNTKEAKGGLSENTMLENGNLELIYAEDGEDNYDESMDTDGNKKISYKEYLRYCEKNSMMLERLSDTKINRDKRQFTTYSFGHASNAYKRPEFDALEGKVKGNI